MADVSPSNANSGSCSSPTEESEDVDIVLDKNLNEEKKLELIHCLKEYPCLWETTSVVYRQRKAKEKAMEDLSQKFKIVTSSLKKIMHSLRTGLNREVKREMEGQPVRWKFFNALSYMKDDIFKSLKVRKLTLRRCMVPLD